MTELKQIALDHLLDTYKAQPVGKGYIDIIVKRENYKAFIEAILSAGFNIKAISWWEYCDSLDKPNKYGMGGPKSEYYDGWFSELCVDLDNVDSKNSKEDTKNNIIDIIENKVMQFGAEKISFNKYEFLTPAFWLDVPTYWENVQYKLLCQNKSNPS